MVIVASHTDTHPPTDLHVTDDGWAYITTTSNFDVYLHEHLHPQGDDLDLQSAHPLPLATLSARLEEAIVIAEKKEIPSTSAPLLSEFHDQTTKHWSDLPLPLYRRMSIVCFDPTNPNSFHGGGILANELNEPIEPTDFNHANWDQETIQTSNDGIVCISSSMSGAAQLCLSVARSNKPILPNRKLSMNQSNSLESTDYISNHSIETLHLDDESNQLHNNIDNYNELYQQQQQQELDDENTNNSNNGDNKSNGNNSKEGKNRNIRQDLFILSTGELLPDSPIKKDITQSNGENQPTSVGRSLTLVDSE